MCLNQQINAQETGPNNWKGGRPDGHAPISVMADHYHSEGDYVLLPFYEYEDGRFIKRF